MNSLANWFTPRRRRAETSHRRAVEAVSTASQPVKAPEPRRPPESRLRAPRGREVWPPLWRNLDRPEGRALHRVSPDLHRHLIRRPAPRRRPRCLDWPDSPPMPHGRRDARQGHDPERTQPLDERRHFAVEQGEL